MGWGWVHDRSAYTNMATQAICQPAAVSSGQTVETHFDAPAPRKAEQRKAKVS
ncbi:hypothetical protein CGLO_14685 [Colletotrichum gloeosporioides Cg-14]|uniref:Uncharacterized protein n=1 Tax=Colletotrichum gloeosporioides (strain Cg-14) TaxID=1237896 RepID=T0L3Q3_COLGC|nr:hypothetical protein CGLO_14685 [Colletotrichum gloeosporioides Cg-14]